MYTINQLTSNFNVLLKAYLNVMRKHNLNTDSFVPDIHNLALNEIFDKNGNILELVQC